MGVRVEDDLSPQLPQAAEHGQGGIGHRAVPPGDGPGVYLKAHPPPRQVLQHLQGPAEIPGALLVEPGVLLVEFAHQVKVADPVAAGLLRQLGHQVEVGVGVLVPVPGEGLLHRPAGGLRALVHGVEAAVPIQRVDRADHIVQPLGPLPKEIQLQPHEDLHLHGVPGLEGPGLGQVVPDLFPGNTVVLLPRAPAVPGEAQAGQAQAPGRRRHLGQGALSVVIGGVGVKISLQHMGLSFSHWSAGRSASFRRR